MNHFTIWDWTDFSRGVADEQTRAAMHAHLSSGCSRCERTVRVLSGVSAMARGEAQYEPPDRAMRYARALYSLHRPEKTGFARLVGRLIHDTALAPLPAGMRSGAQAAESTRHLLYEAGGYFLDVQVEQQPETGRISLVGQIAARNNPDANTANLPVWLLERTSLVASTISNRFGEFQLEGVPARNLLLRVPLPDVGKRLEVSISQAGDGLSDRRRSAHTRRGSTRTR
jgi:hypothetical protein